MPDIYITMSEEYRLLRGKYEKLLEQLTGVMEERQFLIDYRYPSLRAKYDNQIGYLEYELHKLWVMTLRLRRKMELIQMHINRMEQWDEAAIDQHLEMEYAGYMEKLKEMEESLDISRIIQKSPVLTTEEKTELKTLYKKLAKLLHPDVNPDLPDKARALWNMAVEAYETTDIEKLRTILELSENQGIASQNQELNTIEDLKRKCERLQKRILEYTDQIAEVQSRFPFTRLELLSNPTEIARLQKKIGKEIVERKELLAELEERLGEMQAAF